MQTSLFQQIFLVAHGNAILSDRIQAVDPAHVAFEFQEFVQFATFKPEGDTWVEVIAAKDVNAWLTGLKADGCRGLRLTHANGDNPNASDRILEAFANSGGTWIIETLFEDAADQWVSRWAIGDENHPQEKIWQVTYGRIAERQPIRTLELQSTEAMMQIFSVALDASKTFALEHMDGAFTDLFDQSLAVLRGEQAPELHGIAPDGMLGNHEARLIAAAVKAWVFGGMGSWNDISFDGADQTRYDDVSEKLYRAIIDAVLVAANSTFNRSA